jgi:adenine-specific DNA-methyltransferase
MSDNIKKPVDSLKYKQDKRAFIPTSELAGEESNAIKKQDEQAEYRNTVISRGQDPELFWLNKYANDDPDTQAGYLKVDTRSLYVHENINPESLINRLYSMKEDGGQEMSFFDNTDFYSIDPEQDVLDRVADYYKHSADWRNRLIQGDSLLVMNSLLQREGMAGKVQCMYFDPPYGIKYKSNWQMKLNKVNVSDCKDEDISGEPEMIKAYRDTWKDGIHSYLSYLRDRLLVARELLHESGSCFVQISDENVHLVRNIMDEIFGSDNFVSLITFRKKLMPLGNKLLEEMSNFIVWYAKDKNAVKYRQLYKKVRFIRQMP